MILSHSLLTLAQSTHNNHLFNMQEELTLAELLKDCTQPHIIEAYQSATPEAQKKLLAQLNSLNQSYPGGLKEYQSRARKLINESAESANPYADYHVGVPEGITLHFNEKNLDQIAHYEKLGMKELQHTAFVLVAGGLGERLGYPGIKIAIPFQLINGQTFISYYIDYILAFQNKFCPKGTRIPLLIMTSGDTHEKTVQLLKENGNYGMEEDQIIIVKQEKVPALTDSEAHFALSKDGDNLEIETKPHGHGDIHTLLYMHGVAKKWHQTGKKWIIFFQDTNPLSFRSFCALLGVTVEKKFEFNSVAVSRKPGEAVGAITSLIHKDNVHSLTINVEYNQLKGLFADHGGEEVDEEGYSKYPGNINCFVIDAARYDQTLTKTKGHITEFINPKYADATKTKFKSNARLECMMQDYPKLLENCNHVGYTSIDRGFCFTTLKNDPATAVAKYKDGLASESAGSCEAEFYHYNRVMLRMCGAKIEHAAKHEFGGICIPLFPMVSISPKFATCITQMRDKVKNLTISEESSLILGSDCIIEDVHVDGHCEIKESGSIVIREEGKKYKKVIDVNEEAEPYLRIRGYRIQ